jgi:uncharacterized protein YcnI
MRRRFALTTAVATVAVVVVFAAPAFAHVSVTPKEAAKGSTATLTFRVPNEKDNASTTKVEIVLPDDHPVTTLAPQAVPGWTAATSGTASVTWTAGPDAGIPPNGAQTFGLTVGPLPGDTDAFVFKVLQTYSDGEVVRWIEPAPPGGAEPDFPAPALTLTGPIVATTTSAAPSTTAAENSTGSSITVTPTTSTTQPAEHSSGDSGNGALVAAVITAVVILLAVGAYAISRQRRGRP